MIRSLSTVNTYSGIQAPLVLVADDSRTIQSMVASRLERSGYDVLTCANGAEALRLAVDRLPALVILDVEMPEMNGLEVAQALRANDATRDIPIVLLTGRDDDASVEAGRAAGANEYITKPFSPQELASCVERTLGR
jgi:CheY-like chemotaxis protein